MKSLVAYDRKSVSGIPLRRSARQPVDLAAQGRIARASPFIAVLAAVAAVAPLPTAPAALAVFLLAYVLEEWVHLSVHFAGWRGRYFRYIRRHHMYHHGDRGATSLSASRATSGIVCAERKREFRLTGARPSHAQGLGWSRRDVTAMSTASDPVARGRRRSHAASTPR